MIHKKVLLAVLISFAPFILLAQLQIGFSAGINLANAREEINEKKITHSYLSRLNVGADIGYFFNEHWGALSGIYYNGKGWRERYSLGYDTIVTKLNYIEVPLKLAYRFKESGDKNITVSGGVYGAYGLSGKTVFRNSPLLTNDPFAEEKFKRFDFGYVVESSYRIKDQYGAKLGYSHGLLSLERPDDYLKNFLFHFSLFVVLK